MFRECPQALRSVFMRSPRCVSEVLWVLHFAFPGMCSLRFRSSRSVATNVFPSIPTTYYGPSSVHKEVSYKCFQTHWLMARRTASLVRIGRASHGFGSSEEMFMVIADFPFIFWLNAGKGKDNSCHSVVMFLRHAISHGIL